ncbi:BID domain-containing T4SS effector [Bartonella phoceensis]|uniref:BID domain-containing T4SS effector n=1 Tax=Bartonella phoceensis TaxID=270249 RepID=UPI001ABB2F3F|nr:BID domain-containing T4SS effector [Bartonella phoceensis]
MGKKHPEKSSTASFNLEALNTATTTQRSPLSHKKTIDKTQYNPMTGLQMEKIQRWSKTVYGNEDMFLNSEPSHTTTTPQRPPLSKEEMIKRVESDPAVKVCAEKIQRWSKTVYGYKHALRKETNKILKNPAIKDSLLRRVANSPASIHGLAGMEVCGLKTTSRKQAEEGLSYLHSTINVYAAAVEYAYKNMGIRIPKQNAVMERSLGKSSDARKKAESLLNERITHLLVQSNPSVQRYYTRTEHWSQVVYGNAHVFQKQMEDILKDPAAGKQLLQDLTKKPASFHKLAGHNICGFKSNTRICAEERVVYLCEALENYLSAVKQAKERIIKKQQTQQKRFGMSKSQQQELRQKLPTIPEEQYAPQHDTQPNESGVTAAQKTSLSNEQIARLRNSPSVQEHYVRVRYWSQSVYGSPNIFQTAMEDILKNPAMGEQLSQKIVEKPASFHKLAGHNICGFKSAARVHAENYLSYLNEAIERYTLAVKDAKAAILQEQQQISQPGMQASKSAVTTAQATVSPPKAPLSNAEVIAAVRNDDNVQRQHRRVRYWSNSVFGNENVFRQHMENILTSPETAEQLLQDLTTSPTSFHKLAGYSICGFRSRARRNAEESRQHLQHAVKAYAAAVQEAREDITQAQEVQQRCVDASESQKQEITQKIQKSQERQQTQHQRGKGEKGVVFAL